MQQKARSQSVATARYRFRAFVSVKLMLTNL
jgi:hypothetical protein